MESQEGFAAKNPVLLGIAWLGDAEEAKDELKKPRMHLPCHLARFLCAASGTSEGFAIGRPVSKTSPAALLHPRTMHQEVRHLCDATDSRFWCLPARSFQKNPQPRKKLGHLLEKVSQSLPGEDASRGHPWTGSITPITFISLNTYIYIYIHVA